MPVRNRRFWCLLAIIVLAGLSTTVPGCGGPVRSPTAKVLGTVVVDGQPVKEGTIVFESPGQRPANGKIQDGEIVECTTYEPNDGVPVGQHQVAVFVSAPAGTAVAETPGQTAAFDPNYMGGGSLIPSRYNDPKQSGLTAEIAPGENRVTLELMSE